jgi:hypothetical protein
MDSYMQKSIQEFPLRLTVFALPFAFAASLTPQHVAAQTAAAARPWIAQSDAYTAKIVAVDMKYSPENGSQEGLSQYDAKITVPTLANQLAERREDEAVVAGYEAALKTEKDPNVREDLQILIDAEQLGFRQQDYAQAHKVPFINATTAVYGGLQTLLDDQVPQARREVAVLRLKEYAGLAGGYTPIATTLMQRTQEQMAKPGIIFPAKLEIETQLRRNAAVIDGIAALFTQYKLTGWQEPFAVLKKQLAAYDAFERASILPRARTDFRLTPEEYALSLQSYGVDIPPTQMASMAHAAFLDYQAQMKPLAAAIAKDHGWPSADYRDVIRELKKQQLTGDAILPFYENRLHEIEKIIVAQQLVTLPDRPAIIRLGTPAESAQQPAPHMVPPPFLHNTGQRGVFVLPLNMPAGAGEATTAKVDDYTFDAASWTLIAHEARPGHELQFDSMVEHGVSKARALYAFNSTNAEGWGLYAEYITLPYMSKEGQLISLQFRLLRAARAFLDPELQSGKVTPAEAMKVLTEDVCFSVPFANQEVERYTFRSPGQANSYFYGFTRLLALRKETEVALGPKFNQLRFHDFILAQGLLPPGLMKKAVEENFIPAELHSR